MKRPFQIVDVFHSGPASGNPLAVVFSADDLDSAQMLHITRWLNFSETCFLLEPAHASADYRVRIFTPESELPFAGHPTLGSCHAWLLNHSPRKFDAIIQECAAGLITIKRDATRLAFAAPPLQRSGPVSESQLLEIAEFLRIPRAEIEAATWADNGPGWIALQLASADAVNALKPTARHHTSLYIGVIGPYGAEACPAFEVRTFFTDQHLNVREDPVTGSLNAAVAQWLLATGRATAPYVVAQGRSIGHDGRVYVLEEDGAIWIGGNCNTLFAGDCEL